MYVPNINNKIEMNVAEKDNNPIDCQINGRNFSLNVLGTVSFMRSSFLLGSSFVILKYLIFS